jgi:predicted small metal-binding protein
MKKMSCMELGGDCDFVLTAETCEGMIGEMYNHLKEKHPTLLDAIKTTDEEEWRETVRKEWDATPKTVQSRPIRISTNHSNPREARRSGKDQ